MNFFMKPKNMEIIKKEYVKFFPRLILLLILYFLCYSIGIAIQRFNYKIFYLFSYLIYYYLLLILPIATVFIYFIESQKKFKNQKFVLFLLFLAYYASILVCFWIFGYLEQSHSTDYLYLSELSMNIALFLLILYFLVRFGKRILSKILFKKSKKTIHKENKESV